MNLRCNLAPSQLILVALETPEDLENKKTKPIFLINFFINFFKFFSYEKENFILRSTWSDSSDKLHER